MNITTRTHVSADEDCLTPVDRRREPSFVAKLFTLVILMGAAISAQAQSCSDYPGGILDGDAGAIAPAQLFIDRDCTIRNYPASNPLTTNFSFFTQPGQSGDRWLVIFDNVVHTGQMSCNTVAGHIIWFTNGSSSQIQEDCQNLLIPVEKIDKRNPAGTTIATVGVPFTYTLTMPVLFDAGTGTVINYAGSPNELHGVTLTDDLNATGADLTYISHVAYWQSSGAPVAHSFSNVGGLLTFDGFPIIPAGEQIIIEITVVLDSTATNTSGTQFVNVAKWDFGRLIDGVFHDPLPGEWGTSLPLTIAAPEVVVTKEGPTTLGRTLNLGEWGDFALNIQNAGLQDTWNVTIIDQFPDGVTGGMCDTTPEVLSAQVFAADGVTPVPGKGPLVEGTDFSLNYSGAPTCELTITILSAAGTIGPGEILIIDYRTRLDADSQDGALLTNIAGATEWFSHDPGNVNRQTYVDTLTDGTIGTDDNEDAHEVSVALFGYFFEKTVENLTSGANPATIAAPGDTLRYSIRLQTTDGPLNNFTFFDDLGELNALVVFEPGTLSLVAAGIPAGADTSNTDSNGGTNGAGILDIRGLNLAAASEVTIQFDITLASSLPNGTIVSNQADLISGGSTLAISDDPTVNGQADPSVAGDEDPTNLFIEAAPPSELTKAITQTTATIGEEFSYRITVPITAHTAPLYDVIITDDLTASAADLEFVSVTKIAGSGAWTPVNTGTATNLVIEDTTNGIDIPAGEQITVEITVRLTDTATNVADLTFTNAAAYTYNLLDNDPTLIRPGGSGTSAFMTITEPELTLEKRGPALMQVGTPGIFTLDVHNIGGSPAYAATVTDLLPNTIDGGMCDVAPNQITVQIFEADGTTPVSALLVENTDYTVTFNGDPACTLTLTMLTPVAAIGPDQRLIINYEASLDADSQQDAVFTNIAGATEWFGLDISDVAIAPFARTYTEVLTDGTVGVLDHEDALISTEFTPLLIFEKTVANVTSGADPTAVAAPGDTLRYSLRIENTEATPVPDFRLIDELDRLNASARFVPGSLNLDVATLPAGADAGNTDPNGGANGTGLLDIRNLSLGGIGDSFTIEFEVVLAAVIPDGSTVTNQSEILVGDFPIGLSDDPNINGAADPNIAGDEDPTQILIEATPPDALLKEITQDTATIGEEFSYQITVPSVAHTEPLYGVRITDDLTASAADLEFVSVTKIAGTGAWTPVNTGTTTDLVIEDTTDGIDIPAGEQITVEITVRLTDTATNVADLTFTNTAAYTYNLLDNDPILIRPGGSGTSEIMTIVEPKLTLEKRGSVLMQIGTPGLFTLDIHNIGDSPAYAATVTDLLPNTIDGGMCDVAPNQITAQIFEADGVTPVSPMLAAGTDYTVTFNGDPACTLTLTMLTPVAAIGPDQRLIINYEASLDADSQQDAIFTNIAGATEWFGLDISDVALVPFARTYTEVLTDGTVGVLDHEDALISSEFTPLLIFEKTVANVTSGADPTTVAAPGDTLRYSLRIENTGAIPVPDFRLIDELDRLNAAARFQPGTLNLNLATLPAGADASNTDPNGGAAGTGLLDIRNLSLGGLGDSLLIQFDVVLAAVIPDGSTVTNQSEILVGNFPIGLSDDPNINGTADPNIAGDEDPTQILIEASPPSALAKAITQTTATIGEEFSYQITVPSVVHTAPLYDVIITDDLTASAADLEFVSVAKIAGSGSWTPVNTGTATNLVIEDTTNGIDIPAGEQITVEITVRLTDTAANVADLTFTNTAAYTYNLLDNQPALIRPGGSGTSEIMTVVEPDLTLEKRGPALMQIGTPGLFTLDVHNIGDSTAYAVTVTDLLPNTVDGGMCDAAPVQITAQIFEADGTTPVSALLVENTDYTVTFNGDPACTLTLTMLTPEAAIGPDQRLIINYEASLDADSQQDAVFTNIAGATEWFSLDISDVALVPFARTYTEVLTDGTVGVLDHEDALVSSEFTPLLIFEKTVANVTSGADPTAVAAPGDVLRYSLRIENTEATPIPDFRLIDELDRLNASARFVPGSLNLDIATLPAGADAGNTDPNGGANGTGLLDIRNLSLGGIGDSFTIEFEVVLAAVIPDGSTVTNQSEILVGDFPIGLSDDPNINGTADPNIAGDEDPTQILIESAPAFLIEKISTDLTDDPAVLVAGDTLRYTITIQNIGTDNAVDVELVDQIPANTTYVAGSTTLNGTAIADGAGGTAPLVDGVLIYAPEDPTPGVMNAAVADNIATIEFDVVIDANVADGTVISNQAFLTALADAIVDQPSDDPGTTLADDPTQDVVGNLPLLFAEKSAELLAGFDGGSPGIVDPGDVLRYTIVVYNNSATAATAVELLDNVPLNTTYVADSVTLNGLPAGQPDGGTFPLVAGIPISSSDLTPPLPGPGEGTLSPGASATIQFDLLVDAGLAPGALITNQATVSTVELPNLLTDGDGDPSTGPEPTVVVVGDVQLLSIIKEVSVVGGGPAVAGATLEYLVTVRNIGTLPAINVLISDDLSVPIAGYLTYVANSATMNGQTTGVSFAGTTITADYSTTYGALAPDGTVTLRFRAVIEPTLAIGTTVTNEAIVYWNDPLETATATVSIDVGGVPGSGILSGTLWHDSDFTNTPGAGERLLEGWTVTLLRDGRPVLSALTDADGNYIFSGVVPNYLSGEVYSLVFTAPGAGSRTALLGRTDSDFTDGLQRIDDIIVTPGSNLLALNLPIDPDGVIYDSVTRLPIPNTIVTLLDAASGSALPAACFDDAAQQDQITPAGGYYKFDVNFSDPACPSGSSYVIQTVQPDPNYVAGPSALIPPATDATTAAFDVPFCPGTIDDAILATAQYCEVQVSEFAPPTTIPARNPATDYHLHLRLNNSRIPGSSQLFNNHIPLDQQLNGAVTVTKTTPLLNVTRGQLVPYVITIRNSFGIDLQGVNVVDRFPAGFRYIEGSARFDGVETEPTIIGRELIWPDLLLTSSGGNTIKLLLAVGAGVTEGEFTNRALAVSTLTGAPMSEEATATVRIIPDPTFDCSDVTGKVFNDVNRNGYQDQDETGLAGVRVVTPTGLAATTDRFGRYHITCAIVPDHNRGSNFVLKLDDRTLPTGFRLSTRPINIQRATRGKALRMNFGASIHRVVGLDIADAVFEPGSVEIRGQWRPRIELLLQELQNGPAVLRLSYVADVESESLVEKRIELLRQEIATRWEELACCYELKIEPEIFWRLGAPPNTRGATNR